jgi:hypothetical protein
VETGEVNKRLKIAAEQARAHAADRRQKDAEATKAYETFLERVAAPLMKQLAGALKAQGHGFTLFTPAGSPRLASDRQRDDFIELGLERGDTVLADTVSGDTALRDAALRDTALRDTALQVVGHVSYVRGSRTLTRTVPVKAGTSPGSLTDEDLLSFLLEALRPWIER